MSDIDADEAYVPGPLDCCEHCEHSPNDPPHDRPCTEGCNQPAASGHAEEASDG